MRGSGPPGQLQRAGQNDLLAGQPAFHGIGHRAPNVLQPGPNVALALFDQLPELQMVRVAVVHGIRDVADGILRRLRARHRPSIRLPQAAAAYATHGPFPQQVALGTERRKNHGVGVGEVGGLRVKHHVHRHGIQRAHQRAIGPVPAPRCGLPCNVTRMRAGFPPSPPQKAARPRAMLWLLDGPTPAT